MSQTVIGIFPSGAEAQYAVNQLKTHNYSENQIDLSAHSTSAETTAVKEEKHDDNAIERFFDSLFGDDDDKKQKYCAVATQRAIVTVHTDSMQEAERAVEIMDRAGALDIDQEYAAITGASQIGEAEQTAKVIEEEMHVGKKEVSTGGARLRSYLVEKPVEETLRLRVEHIFVERKPVNRPATEADFAAFNEGEIEITEHAERAVVSKEANVVEEVTLGKEVEEQKEVIRDTVRETKVEVERKAYEEEEVR